MGSGRERCDRWSLPLGRALAALPVHLLTGGGGGVMAAVSEGFASVRPRAGLVIGVLPGEIDDAGYRPRAGYPNPFVELAIRTHLPASGTEGASIRSRNPVNVLSADALVILPGGSGTASEAGLALRLGRPAITLGGSHEGLPQAKGVTEVIRWLAGQIGLAPPPDPAA